MNTRPVSTAIRASRAGFTLVELLLVIVILSVLATVAIVNTKGIGNESRASATRSSISSIESAAQMYEIRTGKYPSSMDDLLQKVGDRPAFLDEKSKTDAWGNPFTLTSSGDKLIIRSAGADGQLNTADDITN